MHKIITAIAAMLFTASVFAQSVPPSNDAKKAPAGTANEIREAGPAVTKDAQKPAKEPAPNVPPPSEPAFFVPSNCCALG